MTNKKQVAEKVTISYSRYLEMYKKAEKYNELEEKHKEVETKYNKLIQQLDFDEMLTESGEYDTKKLWDYRALAVWGMDCRRQGCNPYNPWNICEQNKHKVNEIKADYERFIEEHANGQDIYNEKENLECAARELFNKPFDNTYKDSQEQ